MNAKILVVDDEEVVIRSCQRILAGNNYQIDTQTDSRVAMESIEKVQYDVIILDLMMPNVGGMEILRKAKQLHPDVKVILVTGLAQHDTAVRAEKMGAFAYLPKPFDPDGLNRLVQQALENC